MKKICLITGATAGIGQAAIEKLAEEDMDFIFIGRSKEKCEALLNKLKQINNHNNYKYWVADFEDLENIRKVALEIKDTIGNLDILINNAGAIYANKELTTEGFEKTFTTNHLTPFLLTNILLPIIEKTPGARIVNTSSHSHYRGKLNFEDLHYKDSYFVMTAYERSKLANVLFTNHLAKMLKDKGITANSLHPGVVKTQIGNKNSNFISSFFWKLFSGIAGVSVEKGADTIIYLATSKEVDGVTGKYFYNRKIKTPSKLAQDESLALILWNKSLEMTKLY